jgi:colanic acid/amylovoran biosynthesis glycosyltransferase
MGSFGMEYQNLIELKDILGSKFIQSFRGSDINFIPLRCGERIYDTIFQKCDYFHFVSRTLLERARQLGYNKNNFTLIPSSADTNYFKPSENRNLKKKNGKVILVSVGRLDWKKGYEYSLQAAKILKEQGFNFSFYIIGDGEYKDAILQTIQDLSLEDCVELLGAQDRDTVKKYLNIADIFVQASLAEGFGNSFLEASAMDLPCVVTDAGGCPEGVVNGKTGFVVPKRNPEALAEKIKILIKNPKLRQKMGKLGRKQVIKNYMLDRQVEDNIKMYGKVLSS